MHLSDSRQWNSWSAPESSSRRPAKSAIQNPTLQRRADKSALENLAPLTSAANVHKKNLSAIAFPLVLFFDSFHFAIFELYCAVVYFVGVLAFIFIWLRRKWRHWTSVTVTATVPPVEQCDNSYRSQLYRYEPDEHVERIVFHSYSHDEKPLLAVEEEMWRASDHSAPGSDVLTRQQQYQQRAFELLSKALMLDEQNGGKLSNIIRIFCNIITFTLLYMFSFDKCPSFPFSRLAVRQNIQQLCIVYCRVKVFECEKKAELESLLLVLECGLWHDLIFDRNNLVFT